MDKENWNKTESREGVSKLFYETYYDLLRQWNVETMGLVSIIISYFQITDVLKSVLSIWQYVGSIGDRKLTQLYEQKVNMTYRLKSETISGKRFIYENLRGRTNF